MDQPPLHAPQNFINRELAALEFNARVLAQAEDPRVPLLERLRFLCICSSNLDEFFEIRVSGLKQLLELGSTQNAPDTLSIKEQLEAIHGRALRLIENQYRALNDVLLGDLHAEGIELLSGTDWDPDTHAWLEQHFVAEVEPVLSPLGLDPARPFPRIQNKSLNFVVKLSGKDAFGRDGDMAIVQAPRSLPRILTLPAAPRPPAPRGVVDNCRGVRRPPVLGHAGARLLPVPADAQQRPVHRRRGGRRLTARARRASWPIAATARRCGWRPPRTVREEMVDFLLQPILHSAPLDLVFGAGPVNLNRFSQRSTILVARPDLKYPVFTPGLAEGFSGAYDLFDAIRQRDVLLHHPFQSFTPVMDLLRQAAADPMVLAIKQTLYRTGDQSHIVDALVAAAQNGKDVTVVIELRARFDEEANIELSTRLQEAGAHVMYGVVGYKTHAKLMLIVRREAQGIRRYCHLSTGNYHPGTARAYTDYGFFTADEAVGNDVHEIFLQLTSLTQTPRLRRLLQSPFKLHEALQALIEREITNAHAGKGGRIIAKLNALVDPQTIECLYRASGAGVRIDLIVRGVCALRPGLPGVSENIRVRSIIGRFLEHSRVFWFENNGRPQMYLASADWMERNFFRRIEVAFPVTTPKLRTRIRDDLETYLSDTCNAWLLQSDGSYVRATGTPVVDVQEQLLDAYAAAVRLPE